MTDTTRRRFVTATGLATATALAGCSGLTGGGGTGTLATRVSDQPGDISDFSECIVTISEIRIKPADGGGGDGNESGNETGGDGEDGDVETIDAGGATADLVQLQGDKSKLVAEADLETGDYEWLKLQVSEVDATLKEGGSANVNTPGDAPLKFNKSFEIRADTTTSFTADFTPVKGGRSGRYVLQPVAKEVTVSYGTPDGTGTA